MCVCGGGGGMNPSIYVFELLSCCEMSPGALCIPSIRKF